MQTLSPPPALADEIIVSRDRTSLAWEEPDARRELTAERLRLACRCAWCTRDRLTNRFPAAFAGVTIAAVAPIGGHGLHVTFSDGHARGIFPYRYLHELADPRRAA